VATINLLIESARKKIAGSHQNFPKFLTGFYEHYFNFAGISWGEFPPKTS